METRKNKFLGLLSNMPESVRRRYEKDFERMAFKDDADFEEWLKDSAPDFEDICKGFHAQGARITAPKGGAGLKDASIRAQELESYFKERAAQRSGHSAILNDIETLT